MDQAPASGLGRRQPASRRRRSRSTASSVRGAPTKAASASMPAHLGKRTRRSRICRLATEGLGAAWQIDEVAIKPIPACHFTHASSDAAIALHREHALVRRCHREARACAGAAERGRGGLRAGREQARPANSYDAQFSIPYIVATGLLKGRFTLDELERCRARRSRRAGARRSASITKSIPGRPSHATTPARSIVDTQRRHAACASRGDQSRLRRSAAEQRRHRRQVYRQRPARCLRASAAERIRDAVLELDAPERAHARRHAAPDPRSLQGASHGPL